MADIALKSQALQQLSQAQMYRALTVRLAQLLWATASTSRGTSDFLRQAAETCLHDVFTVDPSIYHELQGALEVAKGESGNGD